VSITWFRLACTDHDLPLGAPDYLGYDAHSAGARGRPRPRTSGAPKVSSQFARLFGGLSIAIALSVASTAVRTSTAHAGVINLNPCNAAPLSQPFAAWADPAWYELAPGGDFESSGWASSSGWALSGGAHRVPGSDPYAVTGSLGSWSLELPAGSSAQSPQTCVDAAYPSVRFFIAGTGSVAVSVVVGNLEIPAGVAVAEWGWTPTPVMLTSSAVVAALSEGVAQVSLKIRALTGDPQVDDVYIDPWCRG
jgi:hypothetical protein